MLRLICWPSLCSRLFFDVGLQSCHDIGFGLGASIQFRNASTADGTLEVLKAERTEDHGTLVIKEHWGSSEVTYNIGYSGGVLSQLLTSFSGVAVDAKSGDKVYTWALLPFQGQYVRWTPDCPFLLEGVPKP
jgi:hypothetical protein